MNIENAEQDARYRDALEKLSSKFLDYPDVTLIDIGLNTEHGRLTNEVVLRIHLRSSARVADNLPFPKQIDGIPVIVMYGDYKPESKKNDE